MKKKHIQNTVYELGDTLNYVTRLMIEQEIRIQRLEADVIILTKENEDMQEEVREKMSWAR